MWEQEFCWSFGVWCSVLWRSLSGGRPFPTFGFHQLSEDVCFLLVIGIFTGIGRYKEVFLLFGMQHFVDSCDFLFQGGNCFCNNVGNAPGGIKDVPVVGPFNNGTNREVATKTWTDLSPNREFPFGAVKVDCLICETAFTAGIFSMLAGSDNFAIDGFNQVMVWTARL